MCDWVEQLRALNSSPESTALKTIPSHRKELAQNTKAECLRVQGLGLRAALGFGKCKRAKTKDSKAIVSSGGAYKWWWSVCPEMGATQHDQG